MASAAVRQRRVAAEPSADAEDVTTTNSPDYGANDHGHGEDAHVDHNEPDPVVAFVAISIIIFIFLAALGKLFGK